MDDYIVKVENLSKKYHVRPVSGRGGFRRVQRVISDDFAGFIKSFGKNRRNKKDDGFWALKDVSFKAYQGDVIGIIGRNGAGKSTLLKLISRITEPTTGRIELYGRVGSLLEVGTGFHSELTGRENIFISGAILGMPRTEIKKKFDEIVAFSGVEDFLDIPVKRFSSGMEVRLAFSVAAHLNPNVLLVDEVLSVGDAAFRKKSLQKIQEVSENGGVILFVSHDMNAVRSLCKKALVLDRGKITFLPGPVAEAIDHYLSAIKSEQKDQLAKGRKGRIPQGAQITDFRVMNQNGNIIETLSSGAAIRLEVDFETDERRKNNNLDLSIIFRTLNGNIIAHLESKSSLDFVSARHASGRFVCQIPKLPLTAGNISISLILRQNDYFADEIDDAFVGLVTPSEIKVKRSEVELQGWVNFDQDWSVELFP